MPISNPHRIRLLCRLIGLGAPATGNDAADMGTAIGLDFVLDQAAPPPIDDASKNAPPVSDRREPPRR